VSFLQNFIRDITFKIHTILIDDGAQFMYKLYHDQTLKELKRHVMSFLLLYNYQKKLKALKLQTPYDTIIKIYQ